MPTLSHDSYVSVLEAFVQFKCILQDDAIQNSSDYKNIACGYLARSEVIWQHHLRFNLLSQKLLLLKIKQENAL